MATLIIMDGRPSFPGVTFICAISPIYPSVARQRTRKFHQSKYVLLKCLQNISDGHSLSVFIKNSIAFVFIVVRNISKKIIIRSCFYISFSKRAALVRAGSHHYETKDGEMGISQSGLKFTKAIY